MSTPQQRMRDDAFFSFASDATIVYPLPANENGALNAPRSPAIRWASNRGGDSNDGVGPSMTTPIQPYMGIPTPLHSTHGTNPQHQRFGPGGPLADQPQDIQYARYPESPHEFRHIASPLRSPGARPSKNWIPLPLRPYFWIPFTVFLLACAAGLEVALRFSNTNQGWPAPNTSNGIQALHYAYTLPPVIVASIIVGVWAWTDIEIKKMQPYVDLVHGDSPPQRSLLLDYTRHSKFFVWVRAAFNKHYLVALATLMVLLTLSFQPLAASLLVVKETWRREPDITMSNLGAIGLNQNLEFDDRTSFLTAAGFAGAAIMYDLEQPPFVLAPYTVAPFSLPINMTTNGTAVTNTTAVKSESGCTQVPVSMSQRPDQDRGWTNTVSYNGCNISWQVSPGSPTLFGTDTPTCSSGEPPHLSPVIFWFFTYVPTALASATFCYPTISLWEVTVGVHVPSGNVTTIREIRPLTSDSRYTHFSANVTGPPLNGRAYNGIKFEGTNPDPVIQSRQSATELQLPAAVLQAAQRSSGGLYEAFGGNTFWTFSNQVYSKYLTLMARQVYFLPDSSDINVEVRTFRNRVWLSDAAVHLLAVALFILAIFTTVVQLFHRADRHYLHLTHEPGTIASAVSIGAQTGVGQVLANSHNEKEIKDALKNKRFSMDPASMKIVMEGEPGYEEVKSSIPTVSKRQSIFGLSDEGPRFPTVTSPGYSTASHRPPSRDGGLGPS